MLEGGPLHPAQRDALTAADLGEEIIAVEILPRLPVKSLLRFKSVCRSWQALISDPSFVGAHLNRSKNSRKPAIEIVPLEDDAINIYRISPGCNQFSRLFGMEFDDEAWERFSGELFTSVQHSNGLLLMGTRRELVVCNPGTREHKFLPPGSPCMWGGMWERDYLTCEHGKAGFGFVPGDNVYKVGRYFYRSHDSLGFEVLTLGIDSSWRATADDPPYPIDTSSSPVSTSGGMVYFKIDNHFHDNSPKEFVLAFNLKTEKFDVVPPPPPPANMGKTRESDYWLQELDGTLCFIERGSGRDWHEVWMYKGDGATTHTWDLAFTIRVPDCIVYFYVLGEWRGGTVLLYTKLIMGRKGLAYYDTVSKSLTHAADLEEFNLVCCKGANNHPLCLRYRVGFRVISYVESLVSVLGRCPAA